MTRRPCCCACSEARVGSCYAMRRGHWEQGGQRLPAPLSRAPTSHQLCARGGGGAQGVGAALHLHHHEKRLSQRPQGKAGFAKEEAEVYEQMLGWWELAETHQLRRWCSLGSTLGAAPCQRKVGIYSKMGNTE